MEKHKSTPKYDGRAVAFGASSLNDDRHERAGMGTDFSRVVDVLPGLIWTARADGHVDFVNRGWREYTGGCLDDARGDGWLMAVHPDDRAALHAGWSHILASREPGDLTGRLRCFDDSWHRFVWRIRPLLDEAGALERWCGMLVEVEDGPSATGDASSAIGDFATIADVLPASVLLMTADGEVEYANRQAQEFRGATIEQQKGWKKTAMIHPDEMPAAIARWEHCVRTGEIFEMDFRVRRADGVYRWFHVRTLPVRDAQGRITRWCTLDEDIDDRKRGEAMLATTMAELAASEDRLRATIDTVPGFVWRASPDGNVEFLNQRWCDYTGISMADSLGLGWTSRVHPSDAPALAAYWQALLAAGKPGSFEARLRRFDGVYQWFLIRAVPQLDDTGRVAKWYGQNTDIEDRKRAELLLEGEKHLLGLMAGGTPLASVLNALCELVQASMDGALCSIMLLEPRRARLQEDASASLRLQPGAAPDVPPLLLADTAGGMLEPDAHPVEASALSGEAVMSVDLGMETRWPAWCSAALACGIRANWSMPIRYSCGDIAAVFSILFRAAKAPALADHDRLAQFTHLASIAIERAHSEAALRQSEAFLARTQRLSLTGTVAWRLDTDEIRWSDELYRIYEFDLGVSLTHDLINTRIHPEDIPVHDELLRQRRGEPGDFESEHRLLMPDGRVKFLHLVARMTRDEDGGVAYISAVQDVTQRRLADEALDKIRSELAHVARVATLGTLTASIAHEVNQPLAGIITNANTCLRMLASEPPNVEGARETARRTIRDGNRASDVIKRLRALFAKKSVSNESVDLNEAAREVVAMLLGELQRNGVVVHPDFSDHLPTIRGDRVQLQQVILNLIMNASDAMNHVTDRPRNLRVGTHREGSGEVCLTVSDDGTGFDARDAERLFHAFYTTKNAGMGIGLSVSRSIIESHQGRLWATSHAGAGATFAFALPASAERLPDASQPADRHAGANHVMEDN
jgi:PAS domain S-box-containing protein